MNSLRTFQFVVIGLVAIGSEQSEILGFRILGLPTKMAASRGTIR